MSELDFFTFIESRLPGKLNKPMHDKERAEFWSKVAILITKEMNGRIKGLGRQLAESEAKVKGLEAKLAEAQEPLWIVNDSAELGVKVGDRFFFLYKGDNIEYKEAKHDDGSPMFWRIVGKREFGEVCHPLQPLLQAALARQAQRAADAAKEE